MSDSSTRKLIPLSEPEISGNEWKYVKECLDTGWISSVGSYVILFEKMIADYIGVKHAVATVNGTSALHVSLLASGVKPNDEVIVPTVTFIAPANAVRYCDAYPVFIDCEPDTLCMDVQRVRELIEQECELRDDGYTYNKKTDRRVKAVIPVHVFGHPTDMEVLCAICQKNNIDIIEDATESLGSEYKERKTGSFGKIGCFSFNGNKIITTGGGGMVVTNDDELAARVRHLTTQAKSNPVEYDHDEIGYNYRLTNIQAAMGVAQMERIDEFIRTKRKNAALYKDILSHDDRIAFIWERPWAKSNFWFYAVRVPNGQKGPLMDFLLSHNIQVRPVWRLIHTLPMYRSFQTYLIESASDVYEQCINLPCSIGIQQHEIEYIASRIIGFLKSYNH